MKEVAERKPLAPRFGLTTLITQELRLRLDKMANEQSRSTSFLVRAALENYLTSQGY